MAERLACEFFLVRYVPDPIRNEFVNIGVLLREAGHDDGAVVRFTKDWGRVRCMDPDADTGLLEALEGEIAERVRRSSVDPKPVMTVLEDSLSNSVQLSEMRGCLAVSVAAEMEELMRMYVEPMREEKGPRRRARGRAAIVASMRGEFERAGVWELMRKRIGAAQYTRPGDPLKIDCGYRNGMVRMFQAVSLEGDLEAATVLAFSAGGLKAGVERMEKASLELTAVVEPLRAAGEEEERYRFGVETMEREAIRVVTVSDLARVAETARRELRV